MKPVLYKDVSQSTGVNSHILEKILISMKRVDLIATLTDILHDNLDKYIVNDKIDPLRVPNKLYHVAIITEINMLARKNGWGMSQEHGIVYVYNGIYWERISDADMKRFLSLASIRIGFYSNAEAFTHSFSDAILKQFQSMIPVMNQSSNSDIVLINLQNGTYEVSAERNMFREHRSDDYLTYVLPYEYDSLSIAPKFQSYLDRVLPDSSVQDVLQEFHGYIFTKNLKLEQALILYGNGSNGKSVQFEITRSLLGEHNVSTKSLGDLSNRDSGNDNLAKLKDKLLNYGSEIQANNLDVDMLKRLISGEPVSAREKYKTGFDLVNTCKFIFNANVLPKGTEHTEAYFRRLLIIPYKEHIFRDEADPELHKKIVEDELPGILNWAIAGLNRLLKQKKFSKSNVIEDTVEEYKKEQDSVALFIEDEELIPNRNEKIQNKSLYKLYHEWCQSNKMNSLGIGAFSKDLKKHGFTPYKSGSVRGFYISHVKTGDTSE